MSEPVCYCYSILGLRFFCALPWEIEVLGEAERFLRPLGGEGPDPSGYDLTVRLTQVEALPPVPEGAVFQAGRLYSRAGANVTMYMLLKWEDPPYACTVQRVEEGRLDCFCLPGREQYIHYSRQFSDLLGMETVFLQFQALILHASFVRWQGRGILFTAPSGTGKSTQADLWERYQGAETINGDRAGLRRVDGVWTAYGLPYAGSSGIYRNESAPVAAIVVLAQAGENRMRPLDPAQAMRHLYPEATIHRWDRQFTEQALGLLAGLAAETPVYLLECRPDQGAVELVKQALRKEADLHD